MSVAAVAVGWGEYLNELLDTLFGATLPDERHSRLQHGETVITEGG